jgi:hypothetical protein
MTLPLELGQVSDPTARRAFEQIALHWPGGSSGVGSFVAGSGAPTVGVGVDGSIYLDYTNGRVYGPKAGGVWPALPIGILMRDATTYDQESHGN